MIKLQIMFAASFVDLLGSQALDLDLDFSCPFCLDVGGRLSIFKWSGNTHHFGSSKTLFPQLCHYSASRLSVTKAMLCISF